jgi:glycosyltransferase involved in cell wall biosynthesis
LNLATFWRDAKRVCLEVFDRLSLVCGNRHDRHAVDTKPLRTYNMISIVVPAHNESSVIARTLCTWLGSCGSNEMDIVVVCNGCSDDTANIARRFEPTIRVIETEVASKTYALNLGDQASRFFPRIYVDADIVITPAAIRALVDRLRQGDVLAAAPTPDIDVAGCSWPVRLYFSIRDRLPSARQGFGGSGVYALSEAGRTRFAQFPDVIADDTFVRVQFKPEERETLKTVGSKVFPARTIRQLVAVRTRAHAGTFEVTRRFPELSANRGETNKGALIRMFKDPRLWPGLAVFCYVNIIARCRAVVRSGGRAAVWQRDHTSRVALSADASQ